MNPVMLHGLFNELEKIAQTPGSIAHRMSLGAESPSAKASVQNLVSAGRSGAAAAPPPPPPAPTAAGGVSPSSSASKTPTASDLGISPGLSGSDLGMGGGNPMGGSSSPAPATPPPKPAGPQPGSLLSPQRQKGFGTGKADMGTKPLTSADLGI